jgi:hypothetical protein
MSEPRNEPLNTAPIAVRAKATWDGGPHFGDIWQRLVTNGDTSGTSGRGWRVFLVSFAVAAVVVGVVNTINVVTRMHEQPGLNTAESVIWEVTSWFTWLAFLWVAWLAYRIGPLRRPYWRMAIHFPGAFLFALGHVGGFVLLRKLIYAAAGGVYHFGPFWSDFRYEFSKDAFGYVLMIAGFAINDYVLDLIETPPHPRKATFAIRDGTRIVRVAISEIVAVSSAGNYVEFVLHDGRRPLMRSPLSQIETQLATYGFLRVHRSWLINPMRLTGLKPEGSGDYTIELGATHVPLSRRFPDALARLRAN